MSSVPIANNTTSIQKLAIKVTDNVVTAMTLEPGSTIRIDTDEDGKSIIIVRGIIEPGSIISETDPGACIYLYNATKDKTDIL